MNEFLAWWIDVCFEQQCNLFIVNVSDVLQLEIQKSVCIIFFLAPVFNLRNSSFLVSELR